MKVYYEETYGKLYEVDEENPTKAEEILLKDIWSGNENDPEECVGTVTTTIYGTGDPQFQIMGGKIDALSDNEKEFYLWHLLRYYYQKKLHADKAKYSNDRTSVQQINRLLANVEELDTLLCYEIFK